MAATPSRQNKSFCHTRFSASRPVLRTDPEYETTFGAVCVHRQDMPVDPVVSGTEPFERYMKLRALSLIDARLR